MYQLTAQTRDRNPRDPSSCESERDKMPLEKLRAAAEPRHTGVRTPGRFRAVTNRVGKGKALMSGHKPGRD